MFTENSSEPFGLEKGEVPRWISCVNIAQTATQIVFNLLLTTTKDVWSQNAELCGFLILLNQSYYLLYCSSFFFFFV